jgi:hypothetical protein
MFMYSPLAKTLVAGATLTAFLGAAATPGYAQVPAPAPASAVATGPMVFQGPVQVVPAGPPPGLAPGSPGYPSGSPSAYSPPGYPAPAPAAYPPGYAPAYPPGYAPAYPYPVAPPPYGQLRLRTPVRYESRPMYGLIIAGAVTFGAAYLMTAGITGYINAIDCSHASPCRTVYWPLYIPVAGPIVYMGVGDKTAAAIVSPVLVISSLAQLGGLAMLVAGAIVRKKVPVYAEDAPRLTVAPYFSPSGSGLQALGSF